MTSSAPLPRCGHRGPSPTRPRTGTCRGRRSAAAPGRPPRTRAGRRCRAGRRPRATRSAPPSSEGLEEGARSPPIAAPARPGRRRGRRGRREQLGPVGGGVGPEAEDDRTRLVHFDLAQDQVGGAEQRVDRLPVGADDRFRQRVEGAEQHRGGVDGEERRAHSEHPRGCASVSGMGAGQTPRIRPGSRRQIGLVNAGIARVIGHRHAAAARRTSSPRSPATAACSGAGSGSPAG